MDATEYQFVNVLRTNGVCGHRRLARQRPVIFSRPLLPTNGSGSGGGLYAENFTTNDAFSPLGNALCL